MDSNGKTRHLDLGCGARPRNPLQRDLLYGLDIRSDTGAFPGEELRQANVVTSPIPYPDNFFDSVSAFDFLEHIPRVFPDGEEGTRFPFVELMNEIWRILAPGGVFYALTPAYPTIQAFQDPTHVNFLTAETYLYFQAPNPWARMYGFKGGFEVVRNELVLQYDWFDSRETFSKKYRHFYRGKLKRQFTHLLWIFKAVK